MSHSSHIRSNAFIRWFGCAVAVQDTKVALGVADTATTTVRQLVPDIQADVCHRADQPRPHQEGRLLSLVLHARGVGECRRAGRLAIGPAVNQ